MDVLSTPLSPRWHILVPFLPESELASSIEPIAPWNSIARGPQAVQDLQHYSFVPLSSRVIEGRDSESLEQL